MPSPSYSATTAVAVPLCETAPASSSRILLAISSARSKCSSTLAPLPNPRMSLLPDNDRILLGPGPSLTAPRVMRAMASPTVSHLDPLMMALLDDVRARLGRVFRAAEGSFAFAVSGTGTSGMETAVANLVKEGTRATVIVTGYFGDRLAQMCERYGATVTRLDVEWGRACDPDALRKQLKATPADVVAMVHAETSTGVVNSVRSWPRSRASTAR